MSFYRCLNKLMHPKVGWIGKWVRQCYSQLLNYFYRTKHQKSGYLPFQKVLPDVFWSTFSPVRASSLKLVVVGFTLKWLFQKPIWFLPANCVDPGTPEFGSQTGTYRHLDVLFFNCTEGYDLIGADQLTCNDGAWTNSIPTCQCKTKACQVEYFHISYEYNTQNMEQNP